MFLLLIIPQKGKTFLTCFSSIKNEKHYKTYPIDKCFKFFK